MKRNWCFTIFTDERQWEPADWMWADTNVRYIICQREVAPTTLKKHWQGFIMFARTVRMGTVKKRLHCEWAHLEAR